jgi:hypothetical protein
MLFREMIVVYSENNTMAWRLKGKIVESKETSIARLRHGKYATALLSEYSLLRNGRQPSRDHSNSYVCNDRRIIGSGVSYAIRLNGYVTLQQSNNKNCFLCGPNFAGNQHKSYKIMRMNMFAA